MTDSVKRSSSPRRVHFAPLQIPLERRLQTLAVLFHSVSLPYCLGAFFLMLAFPPCWPILIVYGIFVYTIDGDSYARVARRKSALIRRLPIFRLYCDYFPITIHREVELKPTFPDRLREPSSLLERWIAKMFNMQDAVIKDDMPKLKQSQSGDDLDGDKKRGPRYVFGYHPHGIVSLGAFGAIGTEGAGWENLFPGIPVSLLTLDANFQLPFHREYLLSLGISSVSRRSCMTLLNHDQSICIVVGGAQESLLAQPGKIDLVIKKRLGFVRLAMATPAAADVPTSLVPILSFGENDVYEQIQGGQTSLLYKIQTLIKKALGFTLPLMHARGIFNYDFGLMPYRRPITVVVGKPIPVPYVAQPTEAEISVYHQRYMDELQRLWDTYKHKYYIDYSGTGATGELRFVE
ncbi:diacylglycerol acyltransferase-domain-containing protein [Lipomyces arxii]|uniref:diacylglycerol acyltransferase-domain-containing protein n=1 Tax=Lipomyces arxii TaxID=56418 RepID=UPI0034CE31A0